MREEQDDNRQGKLLVDGNGVSAPAADWVRSRAKLTEVNLQGEGIYRGHRIHVSQLPSGTWMAAAVHLVARDSGFEPVKGEFSTKAAAVDAVKRHVDAEQPGRMK